MSMETLREQNKNQVVRCALELFTKNGIEQTSIREIAQQVGLSDRSLYRYFPNKSDLVLATSYLFWEKMSEEVEQYVQCHSQPGISGLQQIALVLRFYSRLIIENPAAVRYVLDTELALYRANVTVQIHARPPGRYATTDSPMKRAIEAGLADGTVNPQVDVEEIYYNVYDAVLGTMQRQVLGSTDCDLSVEQRMEHLCQMFLAAFAGKI